MIAFVVASALNPTPALEARPASRRSVAVWEAAVAEVSTLDLSELVLALASELGSVAAPEALERASEADTDIRFAVQEST